MNLKPVLLLTGKSFGGVRITRDVLAKLKRLRYGRAALLTIDPYGKGYSRRRRHITLPKWWDQDPYLKAVNFCQNSKGLRGAFVNGAENIKLSAFPDGRPVSHMNIVDHPDIEAKALTLVSWLLEDEHD